MLFLHGNLCWKNVIFNIKNLKSVTFAKKWKEKLISFR